MDPTHPLDYISTAHLAHLPMRQVSVAELATRLTRQLDAELGSQPGNPATEPALMRQALLELRAKHHGLPLAEQVAQASGSLAGHPAWRSRPRQRRVARALAMVTGDACAQITITAAHQREGTPS